MIATTPSISMAPYATRRASVSQRSCFDVVPDATMLWNPEHAPHATVMNRIGNNGPSGTTSSSRTIAGVTTAGQPASNAPVKPPIRSPIAPPITAKYSR